MHLQLRRLLTADGRRRIQAPNRSCDVLEALLIKTDVLDVHGLARLEGPEPRAHDSAEVTPDVPKTRLVGFDCSVAFRVAPPLHFPDRGVLCADRFAWRRSRLPGDFVRTLAD